MEILNLFLILVVGVISGSFGTLVGGGSLLTIPVLIFLGLPPIQTVATNRVGILGLNIAGWYKFHKKKLIDYKLGLLIAAPALIGSFFGARIVLDINEDYLKKTIAIINLLVLAFILIKPKIGLDDIKVKINKAKYLGAILFSLLLGAYGGFYGAGAGTFYTYLLVLLFGQTFIQSAGTRKIANFAFTFIAAIIFIIGKVVVFKYAVALMIGTFIGSYLGAHYSDRIGNKWIRRLFIGVVLVMAIKLFF